MYPQVFEENYTAPLRIRIERRDQTPDGHFRPRACVELTRTLRTSGFLSAIPAEELKSLLFLLSFVTANGDCFVTVPQLAQAMGVSPLKARARMRRLQQWQWQGHPVVACALIGNGLETYRLASQAFPILEDPAPALLSSPPLATASRGEVIAHSRAQYTRPRDEVEKQILEQFGYKDKLKHAGGQSAPRGYAPGRNEPNSHGESEPDTREEKNSTGRLTPVPAAPADGKSEATVPAHKTPNTNTSNNSYSSNLSRVEMTQWQGWRLCSSS
jgi:hypothetical protein